jgi:broad specificity polyphosphatase/5'/3'-nucleotidase SurE
MSFYLYSFVRNISAAMNILRVTCKTWAETHKSLSVKCPLLLSDFVRNFNILRKLRKSYQYQISWKFTERISSCYVQTDFSLRTRRKPEHDEARAFACCGIALIVLK